MTPEKRVLDIGCGWGANIEFLAKDKGVKDVHGVTLSPAQFDEIEARKIPGVTAHCMNFFDYEPEEKFDALTSICMIEHVVSPEEAREGKAVELYRNYFKKAHRLTNEGAWFGLQTILRNVVPRKSKDIRDIGWVTYEIFPGGITPRMEEIVQAVNPYFEVMEVKTRREDYGKTCWHWRARLRDNEALIKDKWGDKVFRRLRPLPEHMRHRLRKTLSISRAVVAAPSRLKGPKTMHSDEKIIQLFKEAVKEVDQSKEITDLTVNNRDFPARPRLCHDDGSHRRYRRATRSSVPRRRSRNPQKHERP